jgi:signal transduction histidine kinase
MTVAVVVLPVVRFAYLAPGLHVALETTNALIALLLAYLVYGRYRQRGSLQNFLLVQALLIAAVANLVLTALPSALGLGAAEGGGRWAALAVQFLGSVALTVASLTSPRSPTGRPARTALPLALAVISIVAVGAVAGSRWPAPVDAATVGDTAVPRLSADPVVLAVQGLAAALYVLAAVAFTRQAAGTRDELLRWVGAGCVLGAAARVHYVLFPSLWSDYVYTGDVLRLGSYLFMLVGAAREIRWYWMLRTRAAVLEDRRRTARELHDGLSQELAYIAAQSKLLAAQPGDPEVAGRIGAAAARAQDEARRAVRAMTRPQDMPFPAVLQEAADDLAQRYCLKVVTDLDPRVRFDAVDAEVLLRIVGEAVRNAVRHGNAERVDVRLTAEPRCLSITDDGRGFTTSGRAAGRRLGGFGITSMAERAAGLGAEFAILSAPGEGTTVWVRWP